MSWDHGYFSSTSYTSGVYRELAPAWLDFAALLKGHQPPRSHEGEAFSYLELGSGMGLGLCLLAAAYPEGRFTGIDFQPDHIVHSRRLAQQLGLANINFQ
jgi:tRNA G46 methylase TrmB